MLDKVVGRVVEEVSELLFELTKHYFRGKPNMLLIAHEIADVWQALENLVNKMDIEQEVQLAKKELQEFQSENEKGE